MSGTSTQIASLSESVNNVILPRLTGVESNLGNVPGLAIRVVALETFQTNASASITQIIENETTLNSSVNELMGFLDTLTSRVETVETT